MGLLTALDRVPFAAWCASWSVWRRCEAIVREQGATFTTPRGTVRARPEVMIGRKALADVRSLGAQFGLTPAARARMQIIRSSAADDGPDNPFSEV